ncbi:hypothetical protein BJX63DRAFT_420874 [Aspergillus granulosus]|uniref:C2H2-type domain-containing protein n=1 Tax=Aspergillus granulosus TaxID=176169 RepID=A0ABR4HHR9_9EURO
MAQTELPAELILHIVECLIPSAPPVVFGPRHIVTRTLCSLTLVCKLVSRTAKHLLIKHCLYIDSGRRLDRLLDVTSPFAFASQNAHHAFPAGLFLSPFPVKNLNIPTIARQLDHLSLAICSGLTRLVIDMPLRWLYPEEDHLHVRPILRKAFKRMTMLEEFCSVRDELYLSTKEGFQEPAIWSFWPRLQRLALYNVAIESSQFIEGLRQCVNLTHLVLVRPDGLAEGIPAEQIGSGFLPSLQRLTIVNTAEGFLHSTRIDQQTWEESFVGRLHALRSSSGSGDADAGDSDSESGSVASYLSLRVPFGRDEEDIEICQEWLSAQAVNCTLWDCAQHYPFNLLQEIRIITSTMPAESLIDLAYGQPDTIRFKTNPSGSNASWKCDICSSSFQRLDHFKRHTAKHKADRPFICDFCGSLYKRGSCSGGQPCSECQSRGRTCSYERLRARGSLESPQREWGGSAAGYVMGPAQTLDSGATSVQQLGEPARSTWDLGPQNFYASADVCYRAYSRLS